MKMYIKSNKWPDYEKIRGAQEFLNQVATDKIHLVEECRNALLDLYAVPADVTEYYDIDHPIGQRESEILRDYKSIAAEEWDDCTVEEADQLFDDILSAIDDINADEATAWT